MIPNPRLARRSLLAALLAGASHACLVPAPLQARTRTDRQADFVKAILAAKAGYAAAGEDATTRFARAYVERWGWKVRQVEAMVPLLGLYGMPLHRHLLAGAAAAELELLERDVVTVFLRATRFFDTDRLSSRPLAFDSTSLPDCGNPFARFD